MTAFNSLMLWADLIPAMYFTSILEGEFFPKWLTVLHSWLSHTADYAEVKAHAQLSAMKASESDA